MSRVEDRRRVGADPRFKVRGVYWTPGLSVIAEPWVALGDSSVGHRVVRCGRDAERAHALVERWRMLTERDEPIDPLGIHVAAAAVVSPRGDVVASWARHGAPLPVPGGEPRWSPLHRLAESALCLGCASVRWAGCWMPRDLSGCAECLPERERDDPRRWPYEPEPRVGAVPAGPRERTPSVRRASQTARIASPGEDRLF